MAQAPLPEIDDENRHFWTGGAQGELQFLHCVHCDYYIHPPAPVCPKCLTRSVEPKAVSGDATVVSFTVNHQPWMPGLEVPYAIVIVELAEQKGLRLTSNVVNCAIDDVRIGMQVHVVFHQVEDVFLPLFEPVK